MSSGGMPGRGYYGVTDPNLLTPPPAAVPPTSAPMVAQGGSLPGTVPSTGNTLTDLVVNSNPVVRTLMNVAMMLGVNPYQLATGIVQDPEGAAATLDGIGIPDPETEAAAATAPVDTGMGEALTGSQPIDYAEDPTVTPPQPGLSSPAMMPGGGVPGAAPLDLVGPATGVTGGAANAPPPAAGTDIAQVLSGVQAPKPPQAPPLGTPGLPSPRSIEGPTLDELVRGALAVAQPQTQAITLAGALGQRR